MEIRKSSHKIKKVVLFFKNSRLWIIILGLMFYFQASQENSGTWSPWMLAKFNEQLGNAFNTCLFETHDCAPWFACLLRVVLTNQEIEQLKRDKNELEDRIGGFQQRIANQETELEVPCSHRIENFAFGNGSLSGGRICLFLLALSVLMSSSD